MKKLFYGLLCLALLTGCAEQQTATSETAAPVPQTAEISTVLPASLPETPEYQTVHALALAELESYEAQYISEPELVSADTMGDILCDKTLSDGTQVVCYWAADSEYIKYWAIRQGDMLLRFYEEFSAYSKGYDVEPFTDVLGQDGFRITAPRGAAYVALDYYILDENGFPQLLAGCANQVIEDDLNGDGQRELLWFYHSGQDIVYVFLKDGIPHELHITEALANQEDSWLVSTADKTYSNTLTDGYLMVDAYEGGWPAVQSGNLTPVSGRLQFTPDSIILEVSA